MSEEVKHCQIWHSNWRSILLKEKKHPFLYFSLLGQWRWHVLALSVYNGFVLVHPALFAIEMHANEGDLIRYLKTGCLKLKACDCYVEMCIHVYTRHAHIHPWSASFVGADLSWRQQKRAKGQVRNAKHWHLPKSLKYQVLSAHKHTNKRPLTATP